MSISKLVAIFDNFLLFIYLYLLETKTENGIIHLVVHLAKYPHLKERGQVEAGSEELSANLLCG